MASLRLSNAFIFARDACRNPHRSEIMNTHLEPFEPSSSDHIDMSPTTRLPV